MQDGDLKMTLPKLRQNSENNNSKYSRRLVIKTEGGDPEIARIAVPRFETVARRSYTVCKMSRSVVLLRHVEMVTRLRKFHQKKRWSKDHLVVVKP
jgi:hypothetical protein